jgi:hypothetical protein
LPLWKMLQWTCYRSIAVTTMKAANWPTHVSTAHFPNASTTSPAAGSYKAYLDGVPVARNLPAAEMALGRKVAVIFFDEHNPKEAVAVAVYT